MEHYRNLASLRSIVDLTRPYHPEELFQEKDLFIAGLDDVNNYLIPSLLVTANDTLLAFCEARERDDMDPMDLVLKRSVKTNKNLQGVDGVVWPNDRRWLPMQVALRGNGDAVANPCPVIDRSNGTIWMCCVQVTGGLVNNLDRARAHNALLLLKSSDDGVTWSEPREISREVGYFIPGPGVGTQMRSGRLIIPGYDDRSSKVIYSDDHGHTWHAGATIAHKANECQAVETEDGHLLLNIRSNPGCRHVALSRDGGETWFQEAAAEALPDPSCMAAFVRYSSNADSDKSRLLFANPANPRSRTQMTVRLSYDEGRTWPVAKMIYVGPSAYSSLAVLTDGTIGLLYQTGDVHPYEKLRFARFSLEWLTDGADRARPSTLPLELPLEWDFKVDPDNRGIQEEWFKQGIDPSWQKIWIDAPWTKQGYEYHGAAWYHLRFTVPTELWPEARLELLFGAADGYADVYLDGVKIGEQKVSPGVMRSRPFVVSLPEAVKAGQMCDLMVRIEKGKGDAGLWKPVCLVEGG